MKNAYIYSILYCLFVTSINNASLNTPEERSRNLRAEEAFKSFLYIPLKVRDFIAIPANKELDVVQTYLTKQTEMDQAKKNYKNNMRTDEINDAVIKTTKAYDTASEALIKHVGTL